MYPADGSGRIDVIVPAEWLQIAAAFAPLALVLALAPFAIWYFFLRRKPEPWSRTQWALNMALDDRPEKRHSGLAALDQPPAAIPCSKRML